MHWLTRAGKQRPVGKFKACKYEDLSKTGAPRRISIEPSGKKGFEWAIQTRPHFNPDFFLRAPHKESTAMSVATQNRSLVLTALLTAALFAGSLRAESLKGKI